MATIKTGPNEIAQWHSLILDAQSDLDFYLPESIEHYVVMTLHSYTTNTAFTSAIIALEFLKAIEDNSIINLQKLRDVGDHCLILSGLFPERAKRKNVSSEYFERIGKEAYYNLSFAQTRWVFDKDIFLKLCENFSDLIRLLNKLRVNDDSLAH